MSPTLTERREEKEGGKLQSLKEWRSIYEFSLLTSRQPKIPGLVVHMGKHVASSRAVQRGHAHAQLGIPTFSRLSQACICLHSICPDPAQHKGKDPNTDNLGNEVSALFLCRQWEIAVKVSF